MPDYIYVLGKDGSPQMPTSGRKACLLLKEGKVSIYRKLPFTIKLNYKTGNTTQPGFLGIDAGSHPSARRLQAAASAVRCSQNTERQYRQVALFKASGA